MRIHPAFFISALFSLLLTGTSFACAIPPKHLLTDYRELIQRTPRIVLAQVIKKERLPKQIDHYYFKTLENLKGNLGESFTMDFDHFGYKPDFSDFPDTDLNSHMDKGFWKENESRNFNGPDCKMNPFFSVGSRYLIFFDQPYHWKSFERISQDNDRWLKTVRKETDISGK